MVDAGRVGDFMITAEERGTKLGYQFLEGIGLVSRYASLFPAPQPAARPRRRQGPHPWAVRHTPPMGVGAYRFVPRIPQPKRDPFRNSRALKARRLRLSQTTS